MKDLYTENNKTERIKEYLNKMTVHVQGQDYYYKDGNSPQIDL